MTQTQDLRTGDIIGDTNRMVILCHQLSDPIPGDSFASWVAICHKSREYHPYVVWNVAARPEGFYASNGHYCSTIKEAIENYEARGGK